MDGTPYKWASGDVASIDEEATLDVSTIMVDTGWVWISSSHGEQSQWRFSWEVRK